MAAPALTRLGAVLQTSTPRGSSSILEGEIAAARVHDLRQQLPALSRGEGVLDSAFAGYQPVRGTAPMRPRTDLNPLDRKAYLLRLARRT